VRAASPPPGVGGDWFCLTGGRLGGGGAGDWKQRVEEGKRRAEGGNGESAKDGRLRAENHNGREEGGNGKCRR
jgi:hypothetical protein